MKKIFLILIAASFAIDGVAQTGPAGVGSSVNNPVWLAADHLTLPNNSGVSNWVDSSGNVNDAIQGTSGFQPTYREGQINSLPAIEFDGVDNRLDLTTNITSDDISVFMVYSKPASGAQTMLNLNQHILFGENNRATAIYLSPTTRESVIHLNNAYSIFSMHTENGAVSDTLDLFNDNTRTNHTTRSSLYNNPGSVVGSRLLTPGAHSLFFQGSIAEIITFDERLNAAERRIIGGYLGAKYDLSSEVTLYDYASTNGSDIIGIGQEIDGSNLSARGKGEVLVDNASTLGNGDYFMIGHDNGGLTTSGSVPMGVVERWTQVWRSDVTGTPGTVDLEFFLGTDGFSGPANYALLIENEDGDFSNGGTTTFTGGREFSAMNISIKFKNVSLNAGDYFTLAEIASDITAISSGPWKDSDTWSCGCIPEGNDIVLVGNTFAVTVDSNANVLDLTIQAGGSVSITTSDSLKLHGDLTVEGSLGTGTGTISALSSTDAQTFTNSTGTTISFNNLYVNSNNSLSLVTGDWEINQNLQVSSGGLTVTSANSVTLTSDASSTSQILASMDNAFTGNFIIQRFIEMRNANYANLSSPMESSTIADIDDNLFLSGLTGPGSDGNATVAGGGIFYSVFSYDFLNDKHDTITSTATAMTPGIGYEVYLATSASTFDATTIDFSGTPTSGDFPSNLIAVDQGWNLLGNPYHSHLDWSEVDKISFIPDEYYIFDTDAGSYEFFPAATPEFIAPEQGFWVNKINIGNNSVLYAEEDKANSTSSAFTREKPIKEDFKLNISSSLNPFHHEMLIHLDPNSKDELDEMDAYFLPSPIKNAPAIFSKAINSSEKLIRNSINPHERSHLIPVSISTEIEGEFHISAKNIENLYLDYSCVYLKDNETAETIDLTVENKYTFSTSKGQKDRFNLILSNSIIDCEKLIEDGQFEQTLDDNLELRNSNGQWYLDYTLDQKSSNIEVRIFNMAGQEVRSPISFSVSRSGNQQLNQLNELNGIYLIQVKSDTEIINKTVKL